MNNFNLFGGGFQHVSCSVHGKSSKYIIWDYNSTKNSTTFHVDSHIFTGMQKAYSEYEYGWLLESKFVTPSIINFCINNINALKKKYIKIFTHNADLIKLDNDLFVFSPVGGVWIEDIYVRNKTKKISMIASNKMFTPGHIKRIEIAKKYYNKLDFYGRGFNEIKRKEEGLEDYMFSICVENGLYESYFTEKILDCFACGTIPVYLGAPDICKHFNKDGIIFLDDDFNIDTLTVELYNSKKEAIADNLEKVKKFVVTEDWIFENYFMEK